MTTAVLTATVARFDAAGSLAALIANGGLFADEAKSGTAYPYCVLTDRGGDRLLRSFDRQKLSRPRCRFRMWGTDGDQLLLLAEALCVVFDEQRLMLAGGGSVEFIRAGDPIRAKEPGQGENATRIWTAWVDYDLFVQP